MSLQTKFLGLMAALAFAVLLNIAAAVWAIAFLEQELSRPLDRIQPVLSSLNAIQRAAEDQMSTAGRRFEDPSSASARAAFEEASNRLLVEVDRLAALPFFDARSGVGTTRTLRDRARSISSVAETWTGDGEPPPDGFESQLLQLRMLIERVEARVIADAGEAATFAPQLRARVIVVLVLSVILTLTAVLIGAFVVRRLVIRRVMQLREAAIRFGKGDLQHRIDIRGRDELATLGFEVNAMASTIAAMQAERVERERLAAVGEMARRIVHNLRSPLAGIRSLAETTHHELPDESDLRDIQDRIIGTVDRFELWLRELLRASAPLQVEPTRTEVAPWITGVIEGQRGSAEGSGIELSLDAGGAPRYAMIDSTHLEHAVVAVIANAIEITPRNGRVSVGVLRRDDRWLICVRDSGPGIAPEAWGKLYLPYFTTKPTGTGIGLAVAQAVARQHGGQLEASNLPGGGAEFCFVLPLNAKGLGKPTGEEGGRDGDDPGHRG